LAAALAACSTTSGSGSTADAGGASDTGTPPASDGGATDATSAADTSTPPTDAAPVDATDAASACGITTPVESVACSQCLQTSCCTETTACLTDSACQALDACLNDCLASNGGDAGSVSACAQRCNDSAAPAVRTEWRAYNDCLNNRCVRNGSGPCQ
jgi:hypothetical protein